LIDDYNSLLSRLENVFTISLHAFKFQKIYKDNHALLLTEI